MIKSFVTKIKWKDIVLPFDFGNKTFNHLLSPHMRLRPAF